MQMQTKKTMVKEELRSKSKDEKTLQQQIDELKAEIKALKGE